jgi:hypothetical protein
MQRAHPGLRIYRNDILIFIIVFAARASTANCGAAFYQDAPRHLAAIANHRYIIQPPGYWLFTRIGGLFPNPRVDLLLLNWTFSAFGAVVFYRCARRLMISRVALWATILYAVIYFSWFGAEVQCTYAAETLFAPLTFFCIQHYDGRLRWVAAAAVAFSLVAGFRPSDGIFLLPLVAWFGLRLTINQKVALAGLVVVFCLAWLLPQVHAERFYAVSDSNMKQLSHSASGAILLGRLNIYSITNIVRLIIAIVIALGPILLHLPRNRNAVLAIWVAPALLFYSLVYFSDAEYLSCIIGGLVLMCTQETSEKILPMLALAVAINAGLFLGYHPIPHMAVFNKLAGNFTWYAVRHQLFQLRIS